MAKISAKNGPENFLVDIQSPTGNMVIADEPIEKGGKDKGFSPKEILISSLAACTSATVRIFAGRKGWDLKDVIIHVELLEADGRTTFDRKIQFIGDLNEEQRVHLLAAANACPVHKILSGPITVKTQIG